MSKWTMEDLEEANSEYDMWSDRWDNYSGNNPNKYRSEIRNAADMVRIITCALKADGTIPLTDDEKLMKALNKAHPDVKHKQVVEFEGRKYERRYYPARKSRSGKTVMRWERLWKDVATGKYMKEMF